jgi:hypothetical protein
MDKKKERNRSFFIFKDKSFYLMSFLATESS